MRILRSPAETPDFENLLTPTDGDADPEPRLPDPFTGAPVAEGQPVDLGPEHSDPFPRRPLGPYRPYWCESTFLRAVGLGFEPCVTALHEWGCQRGRRGVLYVGRSQLLLPAGVAAHRGRYTVMVRLRRGSRWSPAVPMELELIPWSRAFATTWLALCPRRRVHRSRRYFRAGHALLDQVTEGLLVHAR